MEKLLIEHLFDQQLVGENRSCDAFFSLVSNNPSTRRNIEEHKPSSAAENDRSTSPHWTMITVYVILSALAADLAKEPIICSFGDSAEIRQYHGAEGQELIFHLSNQTNTKKKLIKNGKYRIFKTNKNDTLTLDEKYFNQFEQIQTGKIKLGKAKKKHSGEYLLQEFSFTDGKMLKTVKVHLSIYAPVSKPLVSQTCFSPESSGVTCSAEGDEVEFCLTLDGNLLMQTKDTQPLSDSTGEDRNISSVSININGQLTGILTCQVWNKVSKNEIILHLTACKGFEPLTVPMIVGAVTLLLFVVLGLIVRKLWKKSRPSPVHGGASEEIIYSAVNVINRRKSEARLHGKAN